MKRLFLLALALIICLSGCAVQTDIPIEQRWASVGGSQLDSVQAGEQFYFNIPVDKNGAGPTAAPIKIKLSGNVYTGSIRFELRQPDGQVVWNSGTIGVGDYAITSSYSLPGEVTGAYKLGMVYSANTSVLYNLSWQALPINALILLPGFGMILVALAFVVYAGRRGYLGWRYLLLGALFWVLTVVAKFAFAIAVNASLFKALGVSQTDLFSPANLVAYLYIGALTGIFEAGLAWLILMKIRWGRASWSQALAFGIGFGVVEALLLGLNSFGTGLVGLFSPDALPAATLASLAQANHLGMALAPVVERLAVILAHIFACVLLFYAIARRQPKWALLAVFYKTILDAPGGFAAFWGVGTAEKLWTIEGVIAAISLIGLAGIWWISRRYPPITAEVQNAEPAAQSA